MEENVCVCVCGSKTTRAENPIDETQKEELEKDRVKISKRKNGEKRKKIEKEGGSLLTKVHN